LRAFCFARETIANWWKLARWSALLSTERAETICVFGERLRPRALRTVLLQSAQGFFGIDDATNGISFVGIDSDDLFAPSLTVGVLHRVSSCAHKQALYLPDGYAVAQLFRKAFRIGGGVERFQLEPG